MQADTILQIYYKHLLYVCVCGETHLIQYTIILHYHITILYQYYHIRYHTQLYTCTWFTEVKRYNTIQAALEGT